MSDVKWIKIVTNIFDDEKILLIESMPEADSIIVIWFKILTLAGKQNNDGVLLMNNRIPYTEEMLATIFRRNINVVRLALKVFEQFGMIEVINDAITIPNWEKHQNIDGLDKIREQTRKRVAKHRENQKLLLGNVTGNVTVTESNATEEDKEEDKNREEKKIDYNSIKDAYNSLCPSLPAIKSLSEARKKSIRARLNQYSIEQIHEVFKKAEASDFLRGKNDRSWTANFDWIMKDSNMAKILDGNYDNKYKKTEKPKNAQLESYMKANQEANQNIEDFDYEALGIF